MADSSPVEATFRRATVVEAPQILEVLEAAFDRWPAFEVDATPLEHLQWKMDPPGDERPLHAVVERAGRIVGAQLRWIGAVEVQGIELPFEFGTDLSVHPDGRGLGLGSMLRDREGDRLFGQRRVGFDTVGTNQQVVDMYEERGPIRRGLSTWTRSLSWRGRLRSLVRPRGSRSQAIRTVSDARREPAGRGSVRVSPVRAFDERLDQLWTRVRGEYQLSRVRDHELLNWRYLDRRAGPITALQAEVGDQLVGYATFKRDGRSGRVLDLVTDAAADGADVALLRRGVETLQREGVRELECLLPPNHRAEAALAAAGFVHRGLEHAVQITRARNQAVPEIIEVFENPDAPIHLMWGDFDHG